MRSAPPKVAGARTLEGSGKQRVRRWQRPREKRQTVISPEQTEVRIVVPPEVPHDRRPRRH